MSHISTISELLQLSHCQYRIYDVGRKIDKLSKEQFNKVELNTLPYPFPSQGHAYIAIAFWQKQSTEPYLWFVKLPLDERGLLNQGARNHFIAIIVEALGNDLSVDPTEQQEELLKANPYHFTPAQYKLASVHSVLTKELKQPVSRYFEACSCYFSSSDNWQAWQNLGLQGISDFTQRLSDSNNYNQEQTNEQLLISALPHLPNEVLEPVCNALESADYSIELIEALITAYNLQPSTLYLRALAKHSEHITVVTFIEKLLCEHLTNQHLSDDVLITMAGRNWLAFQNQVMCLQLLESLVLSEEKQLFPAIFKDLVSIPTIRPILLSCIRDIDRSEKLAKAIGLLFTQ